MNPSIADVQHRAVLLADMIKLADHLMTESNAPERITDMAVSLIMAAGEMANDLVNEIDNLTRSAT